jgi:glycosyltransferase involved in cell wall biosynthesis
MALVDSSMESGLDRLVVLIPAWQPDGRLVTLVRELAGCGFAGVVVVDDGSSGAGAEIFGELREMASVRVVRHERNLGKGRALKTGMEVVLREIPGVRGVVTADADGQHIAADVVRVAAALRWDEGDVVLGVRRFRGAVPLRCRVGNGFTRGMFRLLTGVRLGDTQTGLRGIPRGLLRELLQMEGERYEYETVVLTRLCLGGCSLVEVPIETVYLEGNRSSHFRPFGDSVRVLAALVRCVYRAQRG